MFFPYSLFWVVVEFRTFRLCGCRHGTQCIPQGNMKSAAGILSVWFSLFARFFRPFSCLEARGSSYFPSEHTMHPPAFFSLCVRNSFLLRFFVRNSFFALSLRENCLVAGSLFFSKLACSPIYARFAMSLFRVTGTAFRD